MAKRRPWPDYAATEHCDIRDNLENIADMLKIISRNVLSGPRSTRIYPTLAPIIQADLKAIEACRRSTETKRPKDQRTPKLLSVFLPILNSYYLQMTVLLIQANQADRTQNFYMLKDSVAGMHDLSVSIIKRLKEIPEPVIEPDHDQPDS